MRIYDLTYGDMNPLQEKVRNPPTMFLSFRLTSGFWELRIVTGSSSFSQSGTAR